MGPLSPVCRNNDCAYYFRASAFSMTGDIIVFPTTKDLITTIALDGSLVVQFNRREVILHVMAGEELIQNIGMTHEELDRLIKVYEIFKHGLKK